MVKPSSLQAFAHRPALVRSKCGFENRIKNTFFIRSVSAYRELLIAAVLVVTIVQHRTSVLDKTACVCSKTSRVEHTKSVHNRPNPAVFVRTAQGLSSNQNEVAINSKSGLWRTALFQETLNYWSTMLEVSWEIKRTSTDNHKFRETMCILDCFSWETWCGQRKIVGAYQLAMRGNARGCRFCSTGRQTYKVCKEIRFTYRACCSPVHNYLVVTGMGPFKCYQTLFPWKFDPTHPLVMLMLNRTPS